MDPLAIPYRMPNDANGNVVPVLRPAFNSGVNVAVTTTSSAAQQFRSDAEPRIARVFAIGCPVYFVLGPAGVAAASAGFGAYVGQDTSLDVAIIEADQYVRVVALTGTGTLRIELLT